MSEKTNIATLDYLNEYDPAIGNAMTDELKRQRRNLELIASENIVSPAVMAAMGSLLTNKYAEGYPGKRYYGGCQCVDVVEEIARQRACELFGAEHANVQPHSGAQANTAVYFAMLNPGDTVMGMNLNEGGHLTHGSPVNISGKYFNFVPYGVDPETHRIDYDKVLEIAKECKPKMIVAGASAYPRIIDFAKLREIADAVGAYLMVDMAHIAGLVAAGVIRTLFRIVSSLQQQHTKLSVVLEAVLSSAVKNLQSRLTRLSSWYTGRSSYACYCRKGCLLRRGIKA